MELTRDEIERMAEFIPGHFAIYMVDGGMLRTLIYSSMLPELSGYDHEEYDALTESDALRAVLDADRGIVAAAVMSCMNGGVSDCIYRIHHRRLGFIWVHAQARGVGMLDGKPVIVVGFLGIAEKDGFYSELLDQTDTRIIVIDPHTYEVLYANQAACDAHGCSNGVYAGRSCFDVQHGYDEPCDRCPIQDMERGSKIVSERYDAKAGIWMRATRTYTAWAGHDAVVNFLDDITALKHMQEQLEEKNLDLSETINNIPGGICVFRGYAGEITRLAANRFMAHLKGVDEHGIVGETGEGLFRRVHPDDLERMRDAFRRMFDVDAGLPGVHEDYRTWNESEGSYIWLHADGAPLLQDDGSVIAYVTYTDVTEKHEAERKLIETNRKYMLTIDNANIGIWEYDMKARRIYEDYSTIQGKRIEQTVDDFPDMMFKTGMVRDDDAEALRAFYERVDAGETVTGDFWFKAADGSNQCNRISYFPVLGEDGMPIKSYGISQVITEQKIAEERYHKEIEYHKALNEANLIATGHDNLSLNEVISFRMKDDDYLPLPAGLHYDDVFTGTLLESIYRDDRARLEDVLDRNRLIERFDKGETHYDIEFRRSGSDGMPQWVRMVCNTFRAPASGDIECFVYLYDVTANVLERQIIRNLPKLGQDAIGLLNAESGAYHLYPDVSDEPSAHNWIERGSYDEDVDFNTMRAVCEEDQTMMMRQAKLSKIVGYLKHHESYTLTYSVPAPQGGVRRKQVRYNYFDDSRDLILLSHSDVTDQYERDRRQMERIERALHEAEHANQAKTEFLNRVSHDIRTPMNVIYGMTDYALKDMDDRPKLEQDLKHIRSSNVFLLSLVNDILDLSKIESGQMELHPEPYPYAEFIENIVGMFEPLCKDKGIALSVPDHRYAQVLVVDRVRLNQIVLNLLSNAVKFTPSGGSIAVETAAVPIGDGRLRATVTIRDSGIGMSQEFQKRMFDPFTQNTAYSSARLAERGTGLGLAIVKRIVVLMDGTIEVTSAPGAGSTFSVSIPLSIATQEQLDAVSRERVSGGHPESAVRRVLLVEDHPINAEIAERMLSEREIEVVWVENGRDAVEAFASSRLAEFDAILMDIQMPIMNGYEATKAIRALDREDARMVPIVAMSADAYVGDVAHARESGMDGHVAKPVDAKVLFGELERVLLERGL